jgi:hypothetical protein
MGFSCQNLLHEFGDFEVILFHPPEPSANSLLPAPSATKIADVREHFEMFPHVGLLFDKPPGTAGLSFT